MNIYELQGMIINYRFYSIFKKNIGCLNVLFIILIIISFFIENK